MKEEYCIMEGKEIGKIINYLINVLVEITKEYKCVSNKEEFLELMEIYYDGNMEKY